MRMPKSGRFGAELVETEWASTNPIANSAREMTPDARRELLDDHWSNWNWNKIIAMRE